MHEKQGSLKGPQCPLRGASKTQQKGKKNFNCNLSTWVWQNDQKPNNANEFDRNESQEKGVQSEGRGRPLVLFQGLFPPQIT